MHSNAGVRHALPLYLSLAIAILLAVTGFFINASTASLLTLIPILLWAIVYWRGRLG